MSRTVTDRVDDATRQRRWAAEHPKRFLAAQIAVGTVDQALLASIATSVTKSRS